MKAAQFSKYGDSKVLVINKGAPEPAPAAGKAIVEIHAASANPFDWKILSGTYQKMIPLQLPVTIGGDFSGIITEAAEGAPFKKGDQVYGTAIVLSGGTGSFAEFASADPGHISYKPKNISHLEAASLPLVSVSAWQALVEHIGLSKGKKILIHGGAGGIGAVAIELAKHLGAHVAATVSERDLQYARGLGADEVIDYKNQKFEELLHGYDAVFDTVGGETYVKSFKALKKGGIIVSMLEQPNAALMAQYGIKAIAQNTSINTARLTKVAALVEQGAIKAHIDKTFPLDRAAEAIAYLQAGHPRGKVAIKVR